MLSVSDVGIKLLTHYSWNFLWNELNAHVSHLPQVDRGENSLNNFDLDPVTLTYYLWPWPCDFDLLPLILTPATFTYDLDLCDFYPFDLDLGPHFLMLGWKLEYLHFWPWPKTYDLVWNVMALRYACWILGPQVQFFSLQSANGWTHTDRWVPPKILHLLLTRELKIPFLAWAESIFLKHEHNHAHCVGVGLIFPLHNYSIYNCTIVVSYLQPWDSQMIYERLSTKIETNPTAINLFLELWKWRILAL